MKKMIRSTEDIFCMAKLSDKYADMNLVGYFDKFIYFSQSQHSVGPRIKFYGGTKASINSRNAPALTFDKTGPKDVICEQSKSDAPNAYDKDYIEILCKFVNKFLPLLLLVWYEYLDEADLLEYFNGHISWNEIINDVDVMDDDLNQSIHSLKNTKELHEFCLNNNLYDFFSRRTADI